MSPTRNYSSTGALNSRGFTMVELLIGMCLALFLTAAMLLSYTFIVRSLIRSSNQQQLEAQSRKALQILSQDVRLAQNVSNAGTVPYDPNDASWQIMPTPIQVTLYLSVPNGTNPSYDYTVKYTYDANGGTLTRTVAGTPPPNVNSNTLTLLTGVSSFSFNYFDQQNLPATNTFDIKQIEVSNFTASAGTAITGTQSSYTCVAARLVLRSKHLVTY